MKKIEALYQEILQNEALKGEFVEAVKDNQVEAFLQKNDCNATPAELQEFAEKKQSEMSLLSDAELDAAAGGANGREAFTSTAILRGGFRCVVHARLSVRDSGEEPREGYERLLCEYCAHLVK